MVAEVSARDRAERQEIFRIREAVQSASVGLQSEADLDRLLERIGDSRFVLLGEASHGTSEYYTWRMRITQRLVREKGFDFIGVEGDWPDCYRVNRFIKGYANAGDSAYEVLNSFERWPTWMWANREVVHLAEWLHEHNMAQHERKRVGFYGLDVYSLWESMAAVVEHLQQKDPAAVQQAIDAYACFEPYRRDEHSYARATALVPTNCEEEVISVLASMRGHAKGHDGDPEASFAAEQNALVAVNAERYYRTMVRSDDDSWNVRDRHMAETLERLCAFHRSQKRVGKAIVWAHNTHLGDARATDMAAAGLINLGQLVREQHSDTVIVGFAAYQGEVVASTSWGAPMEIMRVPPAVHGSWDEAMHEGRSPEHGRLIMLDRLAHLPVFQRPRGQRAIGVVYHSTHERAGNYVPTVLTGRYDALIHFENTRALHPLHGERLRKGQVPETYPSGV